MIGRDLGTSNVTSIDHKSLISNSGSKYDIVSTEIIRNNLSELD